MVSEEIYKIIGKMGIDYISLNLFRIEREGQTYKIYEHIPIEYFKTRAFMKIVQDHFKDADKFLSIVSSIIDPDGPLVDAIGSIGGSKKFTESDNALSALMGLYRFIFLEDLYGWWQFIRELNNCYSKLKGGTKKEIQRAGWYKSVLARLSWL